MIKLNNKNITYVALADTNNSLKAPKEIWYADSNNSVKLVYRRKDALIEGEDYEKYHWLVAEIPIGMSLMTLPINSDTLYYKRIWKTFGNAMYFETDGYAYFTSTNKKIEIYDRKNKKTIYSSSSSINVDDVIEVNSNENITLINNIELQQYGFPILDIWFRNANNITATVIDLTSTVAVNGIERYIPCKLLKPVPKWLDANGIRRQVGECGMIDLVSGKFYGNVNSVGTFTVENYYERKEWLQGNGEAFINTLINPSFGDVISAEGVITSRPNIDNIAFISAYSGDDCFGLYTGGNYRKSGQPQYVILHTSSVRTDYIAFTPQEDGKFKMQCKLTQNSLPQYFLLIDNVLVHPDLVKATINQVPTSSYRIGYLVVEGISSNIGLDTCKLSKVTINSHTIIPCTLTMDLPASMDANNIARTKGTSGMWDLVSDRFYGNVASSGTFKAVNLAEGVDYEVHQWLVGDGAALFNDSINFQSAKWELSNVTKYATFNVFEFNAETYAAFQIIAYPYNRTGIGIFDNTGERGYLYTNVEDVNVIEIKSQTTSSSIVINNTDFSNPTLTIKPYFYLNRVAFGDVKCSSIYVDGIERYIPVKLLKSIPSKYDANGIARQAGECGMYDTVNDKFYGNVASSGTFSVSDDS